MATLNPGVRSFFAYLKTFKRRFFGKNVLTLSGFISIYLNYDTDYNPFRLAILNCSEKLEKEMTIDCLKFVKKSAEEQADFSIMSNTDLFGKGVMLSRNLENAIAEALSHETNNLHEFMEIVLKYAPVKKLLVSYFKTCFDVEYNKLMKFAKVYLKNIEADDEGISISGEISQYVKVVDGNREEYKLPMGGDYKDAIWGMMLKFECNNVIIIAEHPDNVQKYFYNMSYEVSHDISCPTRREVNLLEVDMQAIFQNLATEEEYIDELQKVVNELVNLEEKDGVIIYLKNFNILLRDRSNGFSYLFYIFPLFQDEDMRVIVNINANELQSICTNNRFTELSEFLIISSPRKDEFARYMLGQIIDLSIHHGVYADSNDIEKTLQYVRAMNYGSNVYGTRTLMDYVMALANSNGRNKIVTQDYIDCFKMYFHEQERQTEECKNLIAYHEAGHFVVSRFCKYFKAVYSDLISVVSISDTGGVNFMEFDSARLGKNDYNFYLESLALTLAGRASEELFLGGVSAGAVSDLEEATELATAMITNFGLDKSKKIKGNENMNSEKAMNEVSDKVDEILNEAYELAIQILSEKSEYVTALAKLLKEKKIVSRKEILNMEEEEGDKVFLNYK